MWSRLVCRSSFTLIEEEVFVDRAGRSAFGGGAVVGDQHDQGVVELAQRFQEVEQPAHVEVGVLQETGEDLHHVGIQPLLLGRKPVPVGDIGIVAGELGIRRDDAHLFLALEGLLAVDIPALVEYAFVLVGPLLAHMMGRVHGAGSKIHEEGFVGRHLLGIGDEADGLIHQVFGQVIALFGGLGRLHLVVIVDQLGIVLVGLAAQEAVEALEAAPQRPAVIRTGGRDLVGRGQVPFADGVGVVAVRQQDLREEAVLERDVGVVAGEAGRAFGDAGHGVGVMVAPGQDAGTGGRAQRGGVHVAVAHAVLRQGVHVGRVDRAAVAAELGIAGIVQDDEQDVGRALLRSAAAPARRARTCRRCGRSRR